MVIIIPDNLLEKLRCSSCERYLSVKPVKVYPNKKTKCGRCCEPNDAGVVSLYNIVTDEAMFKCTNRYEGCSVLLRYPEVTSHENTCQYGTYRCPVCPHFKGSAFYFLIHYQQNHEEHLLKGRDFTIKIEAHDSIDDYYMYCQDDFLFIICVSYNDMSAEPKLLLTATSIGLRTIDMSQKFILNCPEADFQYETNKMKCMNFNERGDLNTFEIDFSDVKLTWITCRFEYEAVSFNLFSQKRIATTRASKAVLTYPIHNFSKQTGVQLSPKYYVCDLAWQIVLDFRVKGQLRFFLFCCDDELEAPWSCYVSMTSKVLSVRPNVIEPKYQHFSHTFTKSVRAAKDGIYVVPFEEILDPTLGYIRNDLVTVELELETERVDMATTKRLRSTHYWATRYNEVTRPQLRFFLFCCDDELERPWSCYVSMTSKVLTVRPDVIEPKYQHFSHMFTKSVRAAKDGIYVVPFEEILDPTLGYIRNDLVTVELELETERVDVATTKRLRLTL